MLYYFFLPVLFFFRYACCPDLNVHWGNNTYDICNICFCASRTFVVFFLHNNLPILLSLNYPKPTVLC